MPLFYTQSFRFKRTSNSTFTKISGEFFVLTKDSWNDHGYVTTFYLDYWKDNSVQAMGIIKILHHSHSDTRDVIEESFDKLTEDFISLGSNMEFYEKIIKILGKVKAKSVLTRLRDISIIGLEGNKKFTLEHEGIQNSFFRSSAGRYLYYEVKDKFFLDKGAQDRDYSFNFKAQLNDDDDFKNIKFDFTKKNELPNRLFTIVGKNGVGKTRLLNQLAESLFDSSKTENKNRFSIFSNTSEQMIDNIPIYNKIIAISFSVFDKFYKGPVNVEEKSRRDTQESDDEDQTKFNNYTYIGLHKVDNSVYSADELVQINKRAFKKIQDNNLEHLFIDSINSSNILNYKLEFNFDYGQFFSEVYSSGQSIFITMLCRLLSEIREGSLIFLDEPELYLHPNAIANLARIYYEILNQFKSYAILCTHSPILLQEIPSRYVRKMSLIDGDSISYTKPNIETFGANISDITSDIFNVQDNESLYRSLLVEWVKEKGESEILNLFDDRLSFKTQLFISNLFEGNDNK